VATALFVDRQVIVVPAAGAPLASVTVAVNTVLSPTGIVSRAGVTTTERIGAGAVPPSPPPAQARAKVENATIEGRCMRGMGEGSKRHGG
jgi:hypothetical protein